MDVLPSAAINAASSDHESLLGNPSMFYMYLLTFLSCIGGFLFGYDTGVVSGALILLKDEFNLTDIGEMIGYYSIFYDMRWVIYVLAVEQELIVGLAVAGALTSSIVSGYLTDLYGRRLVILASSILFTLGSLLLALAPNIASLYVGRYIVGLGVGAASGIFPIYVSEAAPSEMRGSLVTTINVAITFGQFFSGIIDASFVLLPTGWRYHMH
jgi:MFS transporter, SP family, solute carrier family 2 (myo-inositol transporter), member 13